MLASAMAVQTVLFAGALGTTVAGHDKVGTTVQYTLIVLLGLAMGLQNAVARRLGVPDLTTTVLTLTLTGLAHSHRARRRLRPGRRSGAPLPRPGGGAGTARHGRSGSVAALGPGCGVGRRAVSRVMRFSGRGSPVPGACSGSRPG
ncbi:DUF1275 family protein [Streptomyces sp. NPDC056178]|uniref:DUF1275 family protein n=1 Tax=Streptomyces sp. NPDC056178 TaxID=3345735 RepID=UPI0035DAF6F3